MHDADGERLACLESCRVFGALPSVVHTSHVEGFRISDPFRIRARACSVWRDAIVHVRMCEKRIGKERALTMSMWLNLKPEEQNESHAQHAHRSFTTPDIRKITSAIKREWSRPPRVCL